MADDPDGSDWVSDRTGLTVLAVVSGLLAALIVLPYLQYVLLGIVLAYVLLPAQRRLEPVVGSLVAALALVAVAVLAILVPLAYVLAIALREALEVVSAVQEGEFGMADLERRLETTEYVTDVGDLYDTYEEPIGTALQGLATSGIEIVSGLPGVLIGLTVTLFVLFALLRDGDRLVAWTRHVLPVDDAVQRELLVELDQLMWASVVGNVAVAAIQAIAIGIGLAVLGVPAAVFLTVATFVFALLPLIGAFGVWVPVATYLAITGQFVPAALLVVYGSLVSASDTYLRPALIGRTSAFNSAIIVVGVFGGIVVFGAVGLFVGPVLLGGAKVTLDVLARERAMARGEEVPAAADSAVESAPETGVRATVDDAVPAPDEPVDATDGDADEDSTADESGASNGKSTGDDDAPDDREPDTDPAD